MGYDDYNPFIAQQHIQRLPWWVLPAAFLAGIGLADLVVWFFVVAVFS